MSDAMRAVGYRKSLPISDPESLVDVEVPIPAIGPHDLLVQVEAVSINPADTKVRLGNNPGGKIKIIGYDAAGVVTAVGEKVTRFTVGDEVWYAGSVRRQGTNAQFHAVDEHVVGHKPASLSFAEAAALPLATITAWETLEKYPLESRKRAGGTLLVLGGAGGVGSSLIQLARALTDLTVVATASRPESAKWATDLGAHHIANHHNLVESVFEVAPEGVDYVLSPFSEHVINDLATIVRPGGHVVAIDEPEGLELLPLKDKSISWHWEWMFTRPVFAPTDPAQHELLEQAARLVDEGRLRTTLTTQLGPINAATLRDAHARVEGFTTIGKIVVAGW
ncbi:zinc-binding alcohol dehydrogenase family protein [Phytohabitans flavus]|uniref:Zinc-type alcohol dehydrogenase-like protein n=1 Tax=Phytohabitans flavus TaxID=1076124 RepID=A0A6F8XLK0_9ACTN|nr:zinc-binding alcohol dehydrogenase family protein [Phytohabitans flavus]BCB74683.1 NADPH:quinone reductase [Phytohabitans flavus]